MCFRCQTISVDPESGQRSKEPMRTLARLRGSKVHFLESCLQWLQYNLRQLAFEIAYYRTVYRGIEKLSSSESSKGQ